ncbi:MAG: carbamoyltransferase HypF [Pseudomonadota bacterium]|nr:carbamoyltransferase HypF [Pseudomonadota bacterium]
MSAAAPDSTGSIPFARGEAIRVRGLVQGVGFRPTVWRLARECGLAGDVCNDAEGVLIRAWGEPAARERFRHRLRDEPPPLARIDALESSPLEGASPAADFSIAASAGGAVHTGIVADAATCDACLDDVRDPGNRRHRYPFTNCTHCGPRLSIVRQIPYDRATTSMAVFPLCDACRAEYTDPADRRFHAQPNACPDCGPRLWLERAAGTGENVRIDGDPIDAARRLLQAGNIVAIKGVGGIHLACDATDAAAVARLRARKHRDDKPFALMARDIAMIRHYCRVNETQAQLLRGTDAPIVLLDADGPERLADRIAPNLRCYGFMLPYTPLHHLLMDGLDAPIVLTSGNRSDEPQCIGNDEARERLAGIADALLLHDRDIVNCLDDSVLRMVAGAPALLRRARGLAPAPLRLPPGFADASDLLAFGGELKNTFCLLRDGQAILSQHLGDLENAAANRAFGDTLDLYLHLFEHRPSVVAVDSHPDYLPSKAGRAWAAANDCRLIEVQHHHAHVAACMADNGLDLDAAPVLGIALDGTGFGDDGTIWGGEFLLAGYRGYRRLAAFAPVPMPGGAQAIRQPWRLAYAHLRRLDDWDHIAERSADLPFFRALADKPLATLDGMIASGFNSPLTSSCGRLFDAVAAVVGLRQAVGYEGQAAIELEAAVDHSALADGRGYPFAIATDDGRLPHLEPRPMWRAVLRDLQDDTPVGTIAARFHAGLAAGLAGMVDHLAALHGDAWAGRVALSGGVFQNAVLSEALIRRLQAKDLQVLRHSRVPANDGGLSLGQAAIAAARSLAPPTHQEQGPCA